MRIRSLQSYLCNSYVKRCNGWHTKYATWESARDLYQPVMYRTARGNAPSDTLPPPPQIPDAIHQDYYQGNYNEHQEYNVTGYPPPAPLAKELYMILKHVTDPELVVMFERHGVVVRRRNAPSLRPAENILLRPDLPLGLALLPSPGDVAATITMLCKAPSMSVRHWRGSESNQNQLHVQKIKKERGSH